MGFCDNPLIRKSPLYLPCWLAENRRGLHATGVFVVGLILAIIIYFISGSAISFYVMIPISLVAAGLTYQYDLVTRAMVTIFAPGAGNLAYEAATTVEQAVTPPSGFDNITVPSV